MTKIEKYNPSKNVYTKQSAIEAFVADLKTGELGKALQEWLKSLEEGLERIGNRFQPTRYDPSLRMHISMFRGPNREGFYTKDNQIAPLKAGILLPGNMEETMPQALKTSLLQAREKRMGEEWAAAMQHIFLDRGGPLLAASFPLYALMLRLDSPEKAEALRQACLQKKPSNRKGSADENAYIIALTAGEVEQMKGNQAHVGSPR